MLQTLKRLRHEDEGASLVEYALLVACIAVVCLSALAFFGSSNDGSITHSKDCIVSAAGSGGTC